MILWASILAAMVSGFGVVNYGALPWIGDLICRGIFDFHVRSGLRG
jgi:hypothetical protein